MIEHDIGVYDKSNIYDLDNRLILNYYPQRIIEKIGTNSSKLTCLDLGLGHGYTVDLLCKAFKTYTVLEGSVDIISDFRLKLQQKNIKVIETYFENYDCEEKYDVVVLGFVLEHVDDPETIINKYKKMLADGGRMYIAVPNSTSLNRQIGNIAGLLDNVEHLSENDLRLGHKRYFDIDSITKLCEETCELKVLNIEGIFLKPITTAQIISLNLTEDILQAFIEVGKNHPELCCAILVELQI